MALVKEVEMKISNHALLYKRILQLKTVSKKVVMCYGSFDLYHIGHVDFLQQAKRFGDALIVIVTDEETDGTYIIDKRSRMILVASHEHVDFVSEGPIIDVIGLIKPDVVVTTYSSNNPPHTKLPEIAIKIKEYGGKFVTISKKHNISKSDIIGKILITQSI